MKNPNRAKDAKIRKRRRELKEHGDSVSIVKGTRKASKPTSEVPAARTLSRLDSMLQAIQALKKARGE